MASASEKSFDDSESILNSTCIKSFSESYSCSQQEQDSVNVTCVDFTTEEFLNSESTNETSESSSTSRGGGITCCVPLCYNNSRRNKDLSFYVIPHDLNIKKKMASNDI